MSSQDAKAPSPDFDATDPGLTRPSQAQTQSDEANVTPQRVAELEAQIKELKEKEAKYLYLYAEFENYKKRAARELIDARKFGWESLALELLEVIDNLERALAHAPQTDKTLAQGLTMVLNQFRAVLKKGGVEEVASLHKPFDPNFHEAVSQEPSEHPEGIVTQEHSRGYTLHGRLLRPSRVAVSSGNPK